ncbi:MAG: hypothetical protein R3D98_05730 [Candidatus Krumholzibacteriia bacterium]
MHRSTRITMALSLLVIILTVVAAGSARAGEPRLDRHGFFAGLDLGAGGSHFEYTKNGQTYESDEDNGGAVGLRLGYAFNPYFSLSLDARGYGHQADDFDYSLGSSTLSATVYPMGGGFFFRVSAGHACLETDVPSDTRDPLIEEFDECGPALGLGLGYDWMVNRHFAIGLSLESRGAAIDDFGEFTDVKIGESSLGATMNYYF